jgi:hypothetical protein
MIRCPGSVRVRGTRQFQDIRKKLDGYSVDGRLSILAAGEGYLCAREERG